MLGRVPLSSAASSAAFWFLGQFWGKAALGKGLVSNCPNSPCSWPGDGCYLVQGSPASPPAPKLHPLHPKLPPLGQAAPSPLPADHQHPQGHLLQILARDAGHPPPPRHPRVLAGLTPPPSSCTMGHPRTFGCWSGLVHESHLFRLGRAAACPWGEDAPCRERLGTRTHSATRRRHSGKRPAFHLSPEHPPGRRVPGSGCSAHGEDAGRQHLLVLSSGSHHGDGCRRHRVVLPRTPAEGRGASLAPQGLAPAFRKAQRPRTTHHWGGKTLRGSAHLHFHPPAAAGHDAGDHQHQGPCGRDAAAHEHLPTRGRGCSPAQTKQLRKEPTNTLCMFMRCPPHPRKKFGCCILLPSEALPSTTA